MVLEDPTVDVMPNAPQQVGAITRMVRSQTRTRLLSNLPARRLESLGFDPIQELVREYRSINLNLWNLRHTKDGTPREKYSIMKEAALMTLKNKIATDLLRYGYARVPEDLDKLGGEKEIPKLTIVLAT